MRKRWPGVFSCNDVVKFIDCGAKDAGAELRALFYPHAGPDAGFTTPSSLGPLLWNCTDKPVELGERTLILQRYSHSHGRGRGRGVYSVHEWNRT
jgi:hypothetical protein